MKLCILTTYPVLFLKVNIILIIIIIIWEVSTIKLLIKQIIFLPLERNQNIKYLKGEEDRKQVQINVSQKREEQCWKKIKKESFEEEIKPKQQT